MYIWQFSFCRLEQETSNANTCHVACPTLGEVVGGDGGGVERRMGIFIYIHKIKLSIFIFIHIYIYTYIYIIRIPKLKIQNSTAAAVGTLNFYFC